MQRNKGPQEGKMMEESEEGGGAGEEEEEEADESHLGSRRRSKRDASHLACLRACGLGVTLLAGEPVAPSDRSRAARRLARRRSRTGTRGPEPSAEEGRTSRRARGLLDASRSLLKCLLRSLGGLFGVLGASWRSRGLLGPSWVPRGSLLGPLGGLLGASWGHLGGLLEPPGRLQGPSWRRSIKEGGSPN